MSSRTVVDDLYAAFRSGDAAGLRAALSPRFSGHVSAGMPCGVGGDHADPDAMVTRVWGRVFRDYQVAPVPESVTTTDDGRVVVHGWYVGTHRASGRPMRAEFVHLLRLDDDGVVELRQITDTASWTRAD